VSIGISTCWYSTKADGARDLLDAMLSLGIDSLELEYRIRKGLFEEIKPLIKKQKIKILSIHNFFPAPEGVGDRRGSGDLFLLSTLDAEERQLAVDYTAEAIEIAASLGCSALILHLGKVDMENVTSKLKRFYDEGRIADSEVKDFIGEKLKEREALVPKHLDSVLLVLDKLNKKAEKYNVYLGVENRYHLHEIPNSNDLEIIFREFPDSNIRYWHDTGHAQAATSLGWGDSEELLEKFNHHMIGIHLHDVKHGYRDHESPGSGEIDFLSLKKYLKSSLIKVVEPHSHLTKAEVIEGLKYLAEQGIG
jgi:sugar phosphate isomerase/epimerase